MRFINFAEAKKAPKKLQKTIRSDTRAVRAVKNSVQRGGVKKALLWDSQGMSVEDVNKKMQVFGEKVKTKRKAIAEKNKLYLANKKIDQTVDDFNRAVQSPTVKSTPIELDDKQWKIVEDKTRKSLETVTSPKNTSQLLKPKGSNIGLKAAGVVGLTALTVGGGVALYRKMRSDKGKKRGSYKNFNFLGRFTNL